MLYERGLISVIAPVFNNEVHIERLVQEIKEALPGQPLEILFVDDGSSDSSWQKILAETQKKSLGRKVKHQVRGFKLSGNFGQHIAILAGLENACGDYIVVIDADLQDDPRYIPDFISEAEKGFAIVHAKREAEKNYGYTFFRILVHRLLTTASDIPLHTTMGNFKLICRHALAAVLAHKEPYPLFERMIAKADVPQSFVAVKRRVRKEGKSAYNVRASVRFIGTLMKNFSWLGNRLLYMVGGVFFAFAFFIFYREMTVTLWIVLLFLGGLLAFLLASTGVGDNYRTALARGRTPFYIVKEEAPTPHR
ncbi:MAG: putative glycosyltransferase [Turneriella sp.]|nr:putative glycosyltransferase [Turneriella sp.]